MTLMLVNEVAIQSKINYRELKPACVYETMYTHKFQYQTLHDTFVSNTSVYVYRTRLKCLSVSVGGNALSLYNPIS